MNKNWIGKAVSIRCVEPLGIFQGTIKEASAAKITIIRAFRNGLPLRTLDTEITIMSTDILKLELISLLNNERVNGISKSTSSQEVNNGDSLLCNKLKDININKLTRSPTSCQKYNTQKAISPVNASKIFGNMIPAKVEVRMTASALNTSNLNDSHRTISKPIDIMPKTVSVPSVSTTPLKNEKRKSNQTRRNAYTKNQAFGTPVDDPMMDEDFDFEKNLALFDKQAIWDEIDAIEKPDLVRQTYSIKKKNYRHDENVLVSKPIGCRQIQLDFQCAQEFTTDDGLIIPTIPLEVRQQVQTQSELMGLSWERQCDMLARGTTEMALLLLGGARRLTPKNQHQWPTIVIICDEVFNDKSSAIGLSTGRQLASHGLKVWIYSHCNVKTNCKSREYDLFKASGNTYTSLINDLPSCDLVILAIRSAVPTPEIIKWIKECRSPILAVDPPSSGITNVTIKYSILPILPVEGISTTCGKLYLCNLGIPDKFYRDAGINYKSPFGHKFVIPLHAVGDDEY